MPSSLAPQVSSLIILAPAKINLRLEVLSRRPDGYHELQMINASLALHDTLEIEKAPSGIRIIVGDANLPTGRGNLVFRAAEALMKRAAGGVTIRLTKRIPIAAGLGGGSSDAAAALIGIDRLFGLGLGAEALREIGLSLGADVPFFLNGGPAFVRGIGERVEPIRLPFELPVILINPNFPVSTKEVYGAASSALTLPQNATTLPHAFVCPDDIARVMRNDLETIVRLRHPEIDRMKSALLGFGAFAAMMSGSGPTVFGLFENESSVPNPEEISAGTGWRVISTRLAAS